MRPNYSSKTKRRQPALRTRAANRTKFSEQDNVSQEWRWVAKKLQIAPAD